MQKRTTIQLRPPPVLDSAPRVGLDALELWVKELDSAVFALATFGFERDRTPCNPHQDQEVAFLRCGDVRFVVRQGTSPVSPISRHVAVHGDGVGDVGLVCEHLDAVLRRARERGLKVLLRGESPQIDILGDGTILHTLRERHPASRNDLRNPGNVLGMQAVDHVSYCLPWGTMEHVARSYRAVLGLEQVPNLDSSEIGDSVDGMRSLVVRSSTGFTVVLTEPRSPSSNGQTQRFVRAHKGAGVQHVAVIYPDLIAAADVLRAKGISFLSVPADHLEHSYQRLRDRALAWNGLRQNQILVDADDNGLLFQLFTKPIMPPSGFFLELIRREGATGFGGTNVRGLFAAIDAEACSEVMEA